MVTRPPLTAVIITLNEEANLPRCLASLLWAEEILVVDSGSTDKTLSIAKEYGARTLFHSWEGYGQQKNWAKNQSRFPWVFFVDADEEVSPELRSEIEEFLLAEGKLEGNQYWGASMPRKTWYLGRWILHGGWYPNRLVRLVHREYGSWTEPPVHERLDVNGPIRRMAADLLHYTFRTVGDQVITNVRFAKLGAQAALQRGSSASLLKLILKPFGKFFETYFWKLGFLDGFPGFVISINAAHSIFMKYVEIRIEKNSSHR